MRENCLENFPGKKSNSIVSTFARNAGQSTRLVTREFKRFRFNIAKIESRESPDLLLISRSTIHKTFSLAPFNFHIPWRICIYMPAKSRKDSVFKSNDNRSLAHSQSATQRREFKSSWNSFPTQLVVFPPRFNYSSTSTLNSLSFSLSDRGLHAFFLFFCSSRRSFALPFFVDLCRWESRSPARHLHWHTRSRVQRMHINRIFHLNHARICILGPPT